MKYFLSVNFRFAALMLCALLSSNIFAHVHWTATNSPDSRTLAIYHFNSDQAAINTGDLILPAIGVAADKAMTAGAPLSAPANYSINTPGTIFKPSSLQILSRQIFETESSISDLNGDLTIEFWFKWDNVMSQSQFTVGLKSGAKILIARDTTNTSYDKLGISATHGSFISAPQFTNWSDVGEEEASLNEWRHVALTIHSTGITYSETSQHDQYNSGTIGRLYYNGHLLGTYPGLIDLEGLKVHDTSAIQLRVIEGGNISIDEMAVWNHDFSENGTVLNPFSNGRGGNSQVADWEIY